MWYGHFIAGNLTRLLALFAFFSLLLSAFQVGLAVEDLQKNYAFNKAAIVFSLVSIFVVSIGALGIIVASIALPLYYTLWPKKRENYLDNEP
jgi:formate-dependent nitrite reductase membrane component NrfD